MENLIEDLLVQIKSMNRVYSSVASSSNPELNQRLGYLGYAAEKMIEHDSTSSGEPATDYSFKALVAYADSHSETWENVGREVLKYLDSLYGYVPGKSELTWGNIIELRELFATHAVGAACCEYATNCRNLFDSPEECRDFFISELGIKLEYDFIGLQDFQEGFNESSTIPKSVDSAY